MIKKIAILSLMFLFVVNLSYSQSQDKNPFGSLLPQEEVVPIETKAVEEVIEEEFPPMALQGVVWGGDFPQAIIDGEVYKVGDNIKGLNAKIFKIEKNIVFIFYGERIYKLKIKKKGEI